MLKGFLALALALFIIALGFIAGEMMKSKGAKWLASLSGVALAVLALALIIPDGLPKQSGTYVPRSAETAEREKAEESKSLTLRNVKKRGDSVDVTCTGTAGNIECKPR